MIKRLSPQLKYMRSLKQFISIHTIYLDKRISTFPIKVIKSIRKITDIQDERMTINETIYTVRETLSTIIDYYSCLKENARPFHYNSILRKYISDVKLKDESDTVAIFKRYKKELQVLFDGDTEKLNYCLDGLKGINSILKEYNKNSKKESEEEINHD